ncbi:MAG: hypothetical protein E6K65_00105 [Nitrospirae bacterium]|nr:MAG: hypothetical protein E6K65_00105 [Nitrospirota bacterium]
MPKTARIAIVLLLSAWLGSAFAQTAEEALTKQSFLSVSAFQCAIVATDAKQRERLFTLGLKSGRDFIETAKSKTDLYAKVRSQIPMLRTMTGGPTTDFILGQVYAQLEADIYKKFDSDEKLWKAVKDNMYREKNCALLQ